MRITGTGICGYSGHLCPGYRETKLVEINTLFREPFARNLDDLPGLALIYGLVAVWNKKVD